MTSGKIATAIAAVALAAAPVAAETTRDAAPLTQENELYGQTTLYWVLGAAAIIAGIIIVATDDDDDAISA